MADNYNSQLKDKRWQIKKSEIQQRDKFTCQNPKCTNPSLAVEVHHVMYLGYEMKAWDYPNDILISLCAPCHSSESWRPILERHLARTLQMKGFLMSDLLVLSSLVDTDIEFTKTLLNTLRNIQNG